MKLTFVLFFALIYVLNIQAQKKRTNFFIINPIICTPFNPIKQYNNVGIGIELGFEKLLKNNSLASIKLSLNQFLAANKIFYLGENLQDVKIMNIAIGVKTRMYKKLYAGIGLGLAIADKHLTDAPKLFFYILKPTIGIKLSKKIEFNTTLNIGNAKEDIYYFQSVGFIFSF